MVFLYFIQPGSDIYFLSFSLFRMEQDILVILSDIVPVFITLYLFRIKLKFTNTQNPQANQLWVASSEYLFEGSCQVTTQLWYFFNSLKPDLFCYFFSALWIDQWFVDCLPVYFQTRSCMLVKIMVPILKNTGFDLCMLTWYMLLSTLDLFLEHICRSTNYYPIDSILKN